MAAVATRWRRGMLPSMPPPSRKRGVNSREQQLAEEQALAAAAATFLGVVLDDEGFDPRSQQHSKLFSSGDEFQSSASKVPVEMPTLSHAEGIATLATAASATARHARPIPVERPAVATKSQMREEALSHLLARLDIALDDLDFGGDVLATDVDVERRAAQLKSAGSLLEEAREILERTKSAQRARSPEIVRLWQAAMDKAVELDNQITCIGAFMWNGEEDSEDGGDGDKPGQVYNTENYFQNPVSAYNAITQVVILLAAVANIIIGVGTDPCNFLLDTVILLIRGAMSLSLRPNEEFDAQQEQVLSEMPLTLDSAMRALKLDPKTTIYAACPACHHTHPPKGTHRLTGDGVYPMRCRNRVFVDKKGPAVVCDTLLVEKRHGKLRPIKPFVYHNLKDYLASTLSDPDIVAECNAACDQAWTAVRDATEKGNSKMSAEFSPEHIKKIRTVQAKLVQALADEEDDGEEEGIVEEVVIENDANKPTPKGNSGAISEREIEDQLALGNLRALRWVAHSLDLDLTGVTKRADYARILMVWRRTMPRKSNNENVRPKAINTDQLKFIQRVIANTATPSWVNGVPSNYGESSAGTIKADEWRVLSTIYLPIALVLLWGTGEEEDPRLRGMLDHSMALFSAVILVCRHVITEDRVAAYRHHLKETG
ncbi:hypothetical protein HMN09_00261900 [Mycena chlorophos]|uniref:Uncharacterized protein n=1 Tax=Mycena chlorophos TaxID=658473 RepID=A0A8H6WHV7_MYCCL|nr:hypothetical protein HMN09_00261900 [Mycena chlorophos]